MWSVLFPDSWSNCTPCMAAPTLPVLDYLIFSHLQTPKWKCRGIWATSFGRRARNVGTVHRLSHSGLLNTKSTVQRTPCLDGEGFGRTVAMCERIWTLRKIPCYSFFFFLSILCWLTPFYSLKGLWVPIIHMYSILLLCSWYIAL